MTFKRQPRNPLFGNAEIGTAYDVYVTQTDKNTVLIFLGERNLF